MSDDSVRVSWDRIDFPEITGYIIYYSLTDQEDLTVDVIETSLLVANFVNSTVIGNLVGGQEYQFQVAAIAELEREMTVGQKSFGVRLTLPEQSGEKSTFFEQ